MPILSMLWGKTVGIVLAVVGGLVALMGIRHKIRRTAQNEMKAEIQERTIERMKVAKDASEFVDNESDTAVDEWLRKHGHYRD